jgi:hypothetical protein
MASGLNRAFLEVKTLVKTDYIRRLRMKDELIFFITEINISQQFKRHFSREFCEKHIIMFRQSDRKSFDVLYEVVSNIN